MSSLQAERPLSFMRTRVTFLLASIFIFAFFSEQYLLQGPLMNLDDFIAHFIAMHPYKPLTLVLSVIGQLGEKFVVVILAIILSGILLRLRQCPLIIPLWISITVTRVLTSIGKNFFLRPRPDGFDDASFPSGHGSTAASMAS